MTLFHSPLLVAGSRQVLNLLQATLEVELSCGDEERCGLCPEDAPNCGPRVDGEEDECGSVGEDKRGSVESTRVEEVISAAW